MDSLQRRDLSVEILVFHRDACVAQDHVENLCQKPSAIEPVLNGVFESVNVLEKLTSENCSKNGLFRLLVNLLIDCIENDGRIVFTASGTHDPNTRDGRAVGPAVEPDAWKLAKVGADGGKPLSSGVRYATAKLCVMLFAYELHRRLRRSGSEIASIAFDPGSVSGTSFLRGAPPPLRFIAGTSFAKRLMKRAGITVGSLDVSGASLAKLAADTAYADGSGKYFQVNDGSFGEKRSATISYDEVRAAKLWDDSKKLVGLTTEEECSLLK